MKTYEMETYENSRKLMETYRNLCKLIKTYENLGKHIQTYANLVSISLHKVLVSLHEFS